jgi:hypothetical protein
MTPPWLALLSPLPADVVPHQQPVASAEQLANGTAGPIAGWQSISVHLGEPEGSRHVLITLDASGKVLSAGDHVMFVRESTADGMVTISDHESVGGRYDDDGSFHGTRWANRIECAPGQDEGTPTRTVKLTPSEQDVERLNAVVADLLSRVAR